ncbi:MAG: hypothetical protein WBC19_01045 [Pyrinomonadaceae bacterium]
MINVVGFDKTCIVLRLAALFGEKLRFSVRISSNLAATPLSKHMRKSGGTAANEFKQTGEASFSANRRAKPEDLLYILCTISGF